jgi:hypothetical protein
MSTAAAPATPKRLAVFTNPIKNIVFGRQNERIEFLMDSYFKLSPEGRTSVIVGGVLGAALFLILVVALYLAALGNLQRKLDEAFAATNKLRELQQSYAVVDTSFRSLSQQVSAANEGLAFIPVLEQKAKELGLTASGFPAQLPRVDLASTNPLATSFQNAKVEFRLSNAPLKKIIDLVIAIESTPHLLRVTSLRIRALYQNKLFFDANLEVEGLVTKQ